MIWIWAVAIIILAMLTKLWTNQLLKQHAVIRANHSYYILYCPNYLYLLFMIELIHHLVQGLRVFYH